MSSLLRSVQDAGIKTQLRGDVARIDREIKARQQAFGVDLYNVITEMEERHSMFSKPSIFANGKNASKIREHFETCQGHIHKLMDGMEQEKSRTAPHNATKEEKNTTKEEKTNEGMLTNASNWIKGATVNYTLTVHSEVLQREINVHKQQFGVDVFDLLDDQKSDGRIISKLSNALGSESSTAEKKIQAVISEAQRDIWPMRAQQAEREEKISVSA